MQDWVDGDVALSKGIIFKATSSVENGSTYNYRTFASFNRASYKPSLSVTYNLGISLNYGSFDLDEGGTKTLTATTIPTGQTVPWSSSNTTVATVSSSGKVTAKKAGIATITAKLSDGTKDTCIVYVTLADGLYYISNQVAGYYLATSGSVENGAEVLLKAKATGTNRNYQLWNIIHLSSGKYVIRPIYRRASALDRDGTNAEIYDIGTSNSLSDVPARTRWGIHYTSSGYVITNNGSSNYAMTVASGATANSNVYVASMLNNTTCFWSFEKAYGMFLYDLSTNTTTTTETVKYLKTGEYVIPQDIDLSIQLYGSESSRTWYTGNTAVASVDITGGIRALENGEAIITLTSMIYGINYSASFKVKVSVIRMTGYELDYEPNRWNTAPVLTHTNCYAYILNNQIDPVGNNFGANSPDDDVYSSHKQQPGAFYNANLNEGEEAISLGSFDTNPDVLVDAVSKDFDKYNEIFGTSLIFQELDDLDDICPAGTYKVALYIKPSTLLTSADYHWYRLDTNGIWSHKRGKTIVKQVDEAFPAQTIYTPENADRAGYTVLVGYFAVSPWNNYYSSTSAVLAGGIRQNYTEEEVEDTQRVSVELLEDIECGMCIEDVIEILGSSGVDIGSGTIIHRYDTIEGDTIFISYIMDAHGAFRVVQISKGEGMYE